HARWTIFVGLPPDKILSIHAKAIGCITSIITNKMKFSTALVTLAFLICAVRCGVILDKLKKVRCDLHHMGDSLISHGHLISDPCPHEQSVNADVTKYENNRQHVVTETTNHGSAAEQHGPAIEDDRHSVYILESSTKRDGIDGYGQKGNIEHEMTTESLKRKQQESSTDNHNPYEDQPVGSHAVPPKRNENNAVVPKKNENNADNIYQGQRVSSESTTSKKNIDMEEVHAGVILFPGETGGGRDDIHGGTSETDMDGARFDHSTTTKASVLTTTKAVDDVDIERNLAKVKLNCPVVDRNNNCITDYS
ncbi:unnamed protein product, partial [Callosobruchus maculatus]